MGQDLLATFDLDEELLPVWLEARIADEDDLLADARVTKSFTSDDLEMIRRHRSNLLASLGYYRRALDIPRPKIAHRAIRAPQIPSQTIMVASARTELILVKGPGAKAVVALGGVATWGLVTGAGETGAAGGAAAAGGATLGGMVPPVLVVAAVVILVHIALNSDKVAEMHRVFVLGLTHAAEPLLNDLLRLQRAAMAVMMVTAAALTAAEIEKLTNEQIKALTVDLVKKYVKILLDAASKSPVVTILLNRLLMELPACAKAIRDLIAARNRANAYKAPADPRKLMDNLLPNNAANLAKAIEAFRQCVGL